MTRALAVLLLLAACEQKGALEIHVAPTDGVTSVRLYIGVGEPTDQPIAPQGVAVPIAPTSWWPLDPHADVDVREVPGTTDEAVFQLERGANGEATINIAILVGFDDTGKPVAAAKLDDLAIPGDSVASHLVTLTPLASQTAFVRTWPAGDNKCVAYADRVPAAVTSMVVDGMDPDCDDAAFDCAPDAYKRTQPATLDRIVCLTAQTVLFNGGSGSGSSVAGCVLGGPACMDGIGQEPAGSCSVTPFCVPATACTRCGDGAPGLDCATNYYSGRFDYANMPTRIDCRVHRDTANGQLCTSPIKVQLDGYLRKNGTKCHGPIQVSHGAGFAPSATFTDPAVVGMATLSVFGLDENCEFSIQAIAALTTPQVGVPPGIAGMVAGMLDNGRGFAIPITLTVETSATCPGTCSISSSVNVGDCMTECLYSPVLPP